MTNEERTALRKELFGKDWQNVGINLTDEELLAQKKGRESIEEHFQKVYEYDGLWENLGRKS